MSAAAKLHEMLAAGMELIPDLVKDEDDRAPDLEGYLRALELAARTHLSVMRLRQAEQEQGGDLGQGPASVDAAMGILLSTSVNQRRELIRVLTESIPQKGMVAP